jgi:hypothetical protein
MSETKGISTKLTAEEKLRDLFESQVKAFNILLEARLVMPLLILVYSTIDIVSYVWRGGADRDSGMRFRSFIDRYMGKYLKKVNANDLWGARCAVIHTGTPQSTASKGGTAREILYSWGTAKVELLEQIIDRGGGQKKYVATSLEDLLKAMSSGIDDFLADLEQDNELCKDCMSRVEKFYCHITV